MSPPMKVCERCHEAKPATEQYFDTHLRNKDRLKTYCRACGPAVAAERRRRKTERSREWARANPEKARESARRSYEKSRRERLEYLRRYKAANRERINAYARAYRERKRLEQREEI